VVREEYLAAQEAASKGGEPGSLRFGLIGCGGQGRGDAKNAARFGRIVAICDVDEKHLDIAAKDFPTPSATATSAGFSNARTWTP